MTKMTMMPSADTVIDSDRSTSVETWLSPIAISSDLDNLYDSDSAFIDHDTLSDSDDDDEVLHLTSALGFRASVVFLSIDVSATTSSVESSRSSSSASNNFEATEANTTAISNNTALERRSVSMPATPRTRQQL